MIKKARTANDIRNHPYVQSLHQEYDGCFSYDRPSWWCYLKPGYISPEMECGSIHEPTIKGVCELLNTTRKATLEEIKQQGYTLAEARETWTETEQRINGNV